MRRIAARVFVSAVFAVVAIAAQAQSNCPAAQLVSPTPGSTLPGSTVTFSWCNASADYFLTVESLVGAHDIFNAVVRVNTITLINLPTNGRSVFVTLWTQISGQWQSPFHYTFTAAGAAAPPPPVLPAADYALSASATALSLAPGQSGTVKLTMTPANGFDGTVSFNCAGLPANVTCKFSPAQLVGNGNPAVAIMTVSVSPTVASERRMPAHDRRQSGLLLACWTLGAGAFGMVWHTRPRVWWLLMIFAVLALLLLAGCGGGAASSAPATQPTPPTQPAPTTTPAPAPQPTPPPPAPTAPTTTPQPASAPQTISGKVMASATGGLKPAANANQEFQIQVTLLP